MMPARLRTLIQCFFSCGLCSIHSRHLSLRIGMQAFGVVEELAEPASDLLGFVVVNDFTSHTVKVSSFHHAMP